MSKERKYYIDNLRILLTTLVILHHLAISYGAPGMWYYQETNQNLIVVILFTVLIVTNQAFFMGMFFMISAYFLQKSLEKKSKAVVLKSRLKRLGIPLLIFTLFLMPLTIFIVIRSNEDANLSIYEFLSSKNWLHLDPLWFVGALLIFSLVQIFIYVVPPKTKTRKCPSDLTIFFFILLIGFLSFLVRIKMYVGEPLYILNFQ